MTAKVVTLADRRPPVCYRISIAQHWDGSLEVFVEDISDDQRSLNSVADALRRTAKLFASKAKRAAKP